jgi:crotonobetainyl-CoA:carnitine CoA-transferase CaiB-like acyl-CoA transferase
VKAMGNPPWAKELRYATMTDRKDNEDELEKFIEQWTINYEPNDIMHLLQWNGVPSGVVKTTADIYDDPQLHYRHHFVTLSHSEDGDEIYETPSFKLSQTPARLERAAPCIGEHNDYVYKELLGLSEKEIALFDQEGAFQ